LDFHFPRLNPYLLLATGQHSDGNGTINLYQINRGNGESSRRNTTNSSGLNPAYVTFDNTGRYALVANYGEGDDNSTGQSVAVFPINTSSFAFGAATALTYHNGSSVNPDRQAGHHPHMVTVDYSNNFAFSTDLGTDQIYQYNFGPNGTLTPNAMPYAQPDTLGDGPRHIAFHPDRLFAYVINEMGNSIDVFLYDNKLGQLSSLVQTVSTLPYGCSASEAAEIAVTPNGKFLYASNRGCDSIVGYYIDPTQTDFHLKRISFTTDRISTPRGFAIDPQGRFLLVGCSTTNEVLTFSIRPDGFLIWTGNVTSLAGAITFTINEYD